MSRYGSVTLGAPNALFTQSVESADAADLEARTNAALAAVPVGYRIVAITLAGAGNGPTFSVTIEAGLVANVDGGFLATPTVKCFLASTAEELAILGAATGPTSGTLVDVQIAGASLGLRRMGLFVNGSLSPSIGPTGPTGAGATGPTGPTGPVGAAGGDLSGTYPNPAVIAGTFAGTRLEFASTKSIYGLIGRFGPEIRTLLWFKTFFQVPIGAGLAVGFPVTEIAVNVAAEFPGIIVGNSIISLGGNITQWLADGETGRPTILYAYVSALEEITFGVINAAAAATSAGTLIATVGWVDPP